MLITKRPWGEFKKFTHNKQSTVKILYVKPNKILSLQYHNHREEMWYFITEGYMQLGNKKRKVRKGEQIRIKKKQLHRLYSKDKLVIVLEISLGKFDESDIIRIEDKYGRAKNEK